MIERRSLEDYLPGDLTIDDFVTQGANWTYFDQRAALAYLLLKGGRLSDFETLRPRPGA